MIYRSSVLNHLNPSDYTMIFIKLRNVKHDVNVTRNGKDIREVKHKLQSHKLLQRLTIVLFTRDFFFNT